MAQEQEQQNKEVLEVSLSTGRYTNTFNHEVIFSVRQNKFVKGVAHKGISWAVDYRLLPGTYLLWSCGGYLDQRGASIEIERVKITSETWGTHVEHKESLVKITINYCELEKIKDNPQCPQSLKDFLEALPPYYHSVGSIPGGGQKVYPPGEIERVIQFLRSWEQSQAEY